MITGRQLFLNVFLFLLWRDGFFIGQSLAFLSKFFLELGSQQLVEFVGEGLLRHVEQTAALLDVSDAENIVRDDGNGLHNVANHLAALNRVVFSIFQQQFRLETQEILGIVVQILLDFIN